MGFSAAAATLATLAFGAGTKALTPKPPRAPKITPPPNEARSPNLPALAAANAGQNAKGLGSTFLTGSSGIDPSSLNLGGTTLLGA